MLGQEMPGVLFAKEGGRGAEGGSGRWGGADDRGPWGRNVTRDSSLPVVARQTTRRMGKRDRNHGSSHPGGQPGNGVKKKRLEGRLAFVGWSDARACRPGFRWRREAGCLDGVG